jgi:hypothetical protein
MPQTINFPERLDDDNSLYLVVNNLRTRLTSNITDSVTTIPVITTAGYPDVGFVTILTGSDITQAEAIAYSGTTGTDFLNAERGSDLTPALEHFINDAVDFTINARHHNNVKDAIIEIEHYLGASGSENFVPFQEGGNVILPGTLSVEETLVVSGEATFCYLTVTGTADFQDNVTVTGNITVGEEGTVTTPHLAVTGTATVSGIPVMINVPADIDVNTIPHQKFHFPVFFVEVYAQKPALSSIA